ncbi:MAG: insulinase family protein [Chlamydiales bacterium]
MKNAVTTKNFCVTKSLYIDELQCHLTELRHEPTGAEILHLGNDDEENVFNLSFRTYPSTSNGVAHILEHTVLCGSDKYPVRDPFFEMTRRSLNTYMNALTGPDFTCYPASSQVRTDFYNLLSVYVDSVFHPLLTRLAFLQEGHRLEFSKKEDVHSLLTYQGIVYNEMKGAMATGEARLNEFLMQALFPDLTYGINSGGDPKEIPHLTYEELKAFHKKFYHPSRCLYYFYGNIPLEQHLIFLEEHVFTGVDKVPTLPLLQKQKRFSEKVYETHTYPITEEENGEEKTLVGMGWLGCSALEQEEVLGLSVLDVVLMGTDASPLKMALLKSNLCKQTDMIMDSEMSEIPLLIYCKGCRKESGKALEDLVRRTLRDIVKKGFDPNIVEGAVHQLEMSRTEIVQNHSPYGLLLFYRSGLLKQQGGNPEDGLRIHTLFHHLRERVKDPKYLTELIEKYFLQNSHFVHITLEPDHKLSRREAHDEKKRLSAIQKGLSDKEAREIVRESIELVHSQENKPNSDVLPKVTLKDVFRKEKEYVLEKASGFFTTYHHNCFTNGLVYVDLVYDLPEFSEEDLSYVRLFTFLLPQMGCGGKNYKDHLDYILQHTGGLGVVLDLNFQADNPAIVRPSLSIRGKALDHKKEKLFPLMRDMVLSVDFSDKERLREILMQHFHSLEASINQSALRYAINLASSGLGVPSKILNSWYGLDYFSVIKHISASLDTQINSLIEKMQKLQKTLLGLEHPDLVLSCDSKCMQTLQRERFYGLEEVPTRPYKQWEGKYGVTKVSSQGRVIASPVAFTTQLFPSIPYSHPDSASLGIAAEIMMNQTLHLRIREQGGAYGSGAVHGLLAGNFYLYSYRDPSLASTLDAFYEAIEKISTGEFGEKEIEEAKLGIFQELDSPVSPGARAEVAYFRLRGGRDPEKRQRYRDSLINATKREIQQAVQSHLLTGLQQQVTVSFAGKEFFDQENDKLREGKLPLFPI